MKSPRSQHRAMKSQVLRFKRFIIKLLFDEEGVSVSVHTPAQQGRTAARLKDHEAMLFRSESSECCYSIITWIPQMINRKIEYLIIKYRYLNGIMV